jgi:hypothetical protein
MYAIAILRARAFQVQGTRSGPVPRAGDRSRGPRGTAGQAGPALGGIGPRAAARGRQGRLQVRRTQAALLGISQKSRESG